jgi:hypothetical protein
LVEKIAQSSTAFVTLIATCVELSAHLAIDGRIPESNIETVEF